MAGAQDPDRRLASAYFTSRSTLNCGQTSLARKRARQDSSRCRFSTPRVRPNSPTAAFPQHCAAQAEYHRLAAQAYSPSDAMSQATILSGRNDKRFNAAERNLAGSLHACRPLFLARRVRMPWRNVGSRRRVRPDRLRHPRGLRGAAEAQEPGREPCEEMDAMLLKCRQDGFAGEDNLYVHDADIARAS